MHDPTQVNRQGPDYGTQYRSGIYTVNDAQAKAAKAFIAKLTDDEVFDDVIATQVEPAATFFPAEDYHQDYVVKTGRACHIANPWTKP
jgi:methionine-S-sulfoxide reductase